MTLDGRYRLVAPIAAGGMSVVWRGYDDVLARPIAVKLLASAPADGAAIERVRREAIAVARISHPYVANVYDYGESRDPSGGHVLYIVMELVEGESLAAVLGRGPLSWPTAAGIGAQVASALAAAHHDGVVHRDVTPANIMLCVDGVKVVDFGISATAGQPADADVFGTPAYLAPERLSGGPVQPATDVYGLGLVLYQMITGGLPWPAETATQMLSAHRYTPPAPLPAIVDLPHGLVALCHQSLAVDPVHRPTSAQLSVELSAITRAGDPRARPALAGMVTAHVPAEPRNRTIARIRPHGATALVDPTAPTVVASISAAPADPALPGPLPLPAAPPSRRQRERGLFVLPAILLALLVGSLAWASLHQVDGAATAPGPTPTAPHRATKDQGTQNQGTQNQGTHQDVAAPKTTTACRVNYELLAQWVFGFTAQVTIVNTGASAIGRWTLRFDLQPGQRVGGGWNGQWHQNGVAVTVRQDQDIPVGGEAIIGFLGTQPANTSTTPRHFTLNSVPCRSR